MFERGEIVRFHYLWARQANAGEESGRKARPVCIVVRVPGSPGTVFLFPITSREPPSGRIALSLSEMECRRSGLAFPCWIILDEYNRVELDKAFDFASTKAVGRVSAAFLEKIAAVIKQASAHRQVTGVNRS